MMDTNFNKEKGPAPIEDAWLKASEARYDSMRRSLQSVRQDIDALTQRIDSTQKSPSSSRSPSLGRQAISPSPSSSLSLSNKQKEKAGEDRSKSASSVELSKESLSFLLPTQPYGEDEPVEVDEYMDIRIRPPKIAFLPQNENETLLECKIAKSGPDILHDKTWRSPSDFNLHDPFDEEQLDREFSQDIMRPHSQQHIHQPMMETDLDDVHPDQEDESPECISPAVSPTFEQYASDDVNLNNIVMSTEDADSFDLNGTPVLTKTISEEEYQVYDDGHALTTIDEASEEIEDDFSSSELDTSTHSSENKKDGSATVLGKGESDRKGNQSIKTEFKCTQDGSLRSSAAQTSEEGKVDADQQKAQTATLKKNKPVEKSSAPSDLREISNSDLDLVRIRAKRRDKEEDSPGKQRPISAGFIRTEGKGLEKSNSASLHSMLSTFSQESMISEADSYVTVCSRLTTTGSDEVYTTACSDSDLPLAKGDNANRSVEEDEHGTLSRRRAKLPRKERDKARDNWPNASYSSDEEDEETLIRTPEAIVVTPKFSRLPSKLASPSDSFSGSSSQPETAQAVEPVFVSKTASGGDQRDAKPGETQAVGQTSHKRVILQRPVRRSPVRSQELSHETNPISDLSKSSSSPSSSEDEADYDAAHAMSWGLLENNGTGGMLLPNLVYKPSLQAELEMQEGQRKRLSCIEESSNSSAGDGHSSEADDPVESIKNQTDDFSGSDKQSSSSGPQGEQPGMVVIPKYFSATTPTQNTQATVALNTVQTTPVTIDVAGASTQLRTVKRLDETNGPVSAELESIKVDRRGLEKQTGKVKTNSPTNGSSRFQPNKRRQNLDDNAKESQTAPGSRQNLTQSDVDLNTKKSETKEAKPIRKPDETEVSVETDHSPESEQLGTTMPGVHSQWYENSDYYISSPTGTAQQRAQKKSNGYFGETVNSSMKTSLHSSGYGVKSTVPYQASTQRSAAPSAASSEIARKIRPFDSADKTDYKRGRTADGSHVYMSTVVERSSDGRDPRFSVTLAAHQVEQPLNTSNDYENEYDTRPAQFTRVMPALVSSGTQQLQFESLYRVPPDANKDFTFTEAPKTPFTKTTVEELPIEGGMAQASASAHEAMNKAVGRSPPWSMVNRVQDQVERTLQSFEDGQNPPYMSAERSNGNSERYTSVRAPSEGGSDIQAASQRKSRILHGNADYFDASVKFIPGPQVPVPQKAEPSYIGSPVQADKTNAPERPDNTQYQYDVNTKQQPLEKVSSTDKKLISVLSSKHCSAQSEPSRYNQVKLMHAPSATGPAQQETTELPPGPRRRPASPSPPRSNIRQSATKSSTQMLRPRWQLKPIPTDNEIRERLRSRSRQRAEERQSRSSYQEEGGVYRPRSSRSDSRYRCTDIDSAIAESRVDVADTAQSSRRSSEMNSDAKQSASLFDLDARLHKATTPMGTQNAPIRFARASVEKASTNRLGDAKSYNSLLETDIDTGENFERPVVLETDVDKLETQLNNQPFERSSRDEYQPKTCSLFNLTFAHTPGTYRRQTTNEFHTEKEPIEPVGQSPVEQINNWQRTKSLQGLPHHGKDSPLPPSGFQGDSQRGRLQSPGAKGLIDRLRERAKSTYELQVAQSLTKLRVPEWLDKAECLSRSVIESTDAIGTDPVGRKQYHTDSLKSIPLTDTYINHPRPHLSSVRSFSSVRRPSELQNYNWLHNSTRVETIAEPVVPKTGGSHQPRFFRPSQEMRQRGDSASRLKPITSRLYSSMRSLAASRNSDIQSRPTDIRPQVAPRANRPYQSNTMAQGTVMKLSPQDFVPKHEQLWGRDLNGENWRYERATTEPPEQTNLIGQPDPNLHYTTFVSDTERRMKSDVYPKSLSSQFVHSPGDAGNADRSFEKSLGDIKPADYDSGTENSGDHTNSPAQQTKVKPPQVSPKPRPEELHPEQKLEMIKNYMPNSTKNGTAAGVQNALPSHEEPTSQRTESDWRSMDAEGESESDVTDGFDRISDLTCMTSLVDTCSSRHRALLANRPSAFEHLLTSLGWWPPVPEAEHHHLPPTAAEAISIAAHEFDVEDDPHKLEFLRILSGPESRGPINLSEFGLNQLSGTVHRKQEDGLLYISCGRAECTRSPLRVLEAQSWRACPNCYTMYCSTSCRALDRASVQNHPAVCSFARVKRVCSRILRNLAPGQITSLTALAKTGMTRLGRGGILLPFALVRHAELFLQRSQTDPFITSDSFENTLEKASAGWEKHHLPSPGGLMSPPLYLTLSELEELDSTVAIPCRNYVPSTSMVLIIVVCAYELIARPDGRPVHLFKQSMILPFPAHSSTAGKKPQSSERKTAPPELPPSKPVLPKTNGTLSKPDRQAMASREAYMIRLQRILREHGVSLRHQHSDIYTQIASFVETGIPFSPIRLIFHDFVQREEVACIIKPMADPQIYPTSQLRHQTTSSGSVYEDIDGKNGSPSSNAGAASGGGNVQQNVVSRRPDQNLAKGRKGAHPVPETNF
ncbi:unnamed protein product [Calicophoron daubneyi]|uniref:Apical junction molecule ajm1 alpha/beta domain-containing protein n=1 Tax=Calicophoron daubneyi TaxID=300641 RepID=A0AAV2TYC7_CALDB